MTSYRVLRERFVPPRSVAIGPKGGHKYFKRGDEFAAAPSPLLRRAVRDGDLEVVVPASQPATEEAAPVITKTRGKK